MLTCWFSFSHFCAISIFCVTLPLVFSKLFSFLTFPVFLHFYLFSIFLLSFSYFLDDGHPSLYLSLSHSLTLSFILSLSVCVCVCVCVSFNFFLVVFLCLLTYFAIILFSEQYILSLSVSFSVSSFLSFALSASASFVPTFRLIR